MKDHHKMPPAAVEPRAERPARTLRPELEGRVLREAEWLNPGLGRAPKGQK